MSLSPYTVVVFSQDTGNVVPFASVEVKVRNTDGSSGALADIYNDSSGASPIIQPGAQTNARGSMQFYALPGDYNIEYESGIETIILPIEVCSSESQAIDIYDDPHTWTALNDFTGGLQKNGVDVLSEVESDAKYVDFVSAQTITGQKNFTGGLLKNNTDVVSLGDLTVGSAASQALASVSMEQFNTNKANGLYDDYTSAEGSIAVGYLNGLFGQFNFFSANGANLEKLKSSAIEVSGSGYALNQNPTWQDTLDGWEFQTGCVTQINPPSSTVRVANQVLKLDTTQNEGRFFSDPVPIGQGNTYTVSVWVYQTGSASQYLLVNFYDATGAQITGSSGGATGWGGLGTYHYFGLVNQAHTGAWAKYEIKMGANGDATIPAGAVSCRLGMLANQNGDWANTTVYLQDYRIEKAMGGVHIENGAVTAEHIQSKTAFIQELTTNQIFGTNAQFTGSVAVENLTGNTISGKTISGGEVNGATVQTATDTSRRVILKDDGTYLLWAGSGTKNDANATFFIKADGTGFVKGEFFQGEILETASQNGSFTTGSPWSITASNHNSAGKSVKIDIAASFNATFTGNKTTENYTLICTVKRGTTTIGTRTFYNAPAFYNSINGTTDISINGQSFVTDSSTAVGNRSYTLEVSLGGGGGTYNNVDVDLSIYTLENKLES